MYPCGANCPHGGCCVLDRGHGGLHDTRYCRFTDAQSLTDAAADALYLANYPDMAGMVALQRSIEASIREDAS